MPHGTRSMMAAVIRGAVVMGALFASFLLPPATSAGVHFNFGVSLPLPPGVHVSIGNFEPYYVGRVFYRPLGVWRPVYAFPTLTVEGVMWVPCVYDRGRIVWHDSIPGPEWGYGQWIREGHGHYDPAWRRPVARARGRAHYGWDGDWNHGKGGRDHHHHRRGGGRDRDDDSDSD